MVLHVRFVKLSAGAEAAKEAQPSVVVSHLLLKKAAVSLAAVMVVQVAAEPDSLWQLPSPGSWLVPWRGGMLLLDAC